MGTNPTNAPVHLPRQRAVQEKQKPAGVRCCRGGPAMPLRDHFRPPLDHAHSWEELHGQWPAVIVQHLRTKLPPGYEAAPRVHSGSQVEIDVAAFEKDEPPQPSVAIETTLPDYDEYEVRIYDAKRHRH